jgi:aspartate aminotransferase
MSHPLLSAHFQSRQPSPIRLAQIAFMERQKEDAAGGKPAVSAINTAIGNVSLPMHPAMQKRMFELGNANSPFKGGVVKYSPTVGEAETNATFLHVIESSGFATEGLYCQVTDGGSQAMELVIVGVCGAAGAASGAPLLLIDAAYSNYISFAQRTGRRTVSVTRQLQDDGTFALPDFAEIEKVIERERPAALLVIPYDNPTGQFYPQHTLNALAEICVKHNLWMISDEAYRELFYTSDTTSSIWGISEKDVPSITGRRISIESASKVWNACGLRIGAIVTDNQSFHQQAVAENTANLCSNVIGQYIFGALAHETNVALKTWYAQQRAYYAQLSQKLTTQLCAKMPQLIISQPDAAIYSVIDVKHAVKPNFRMIDFVMYCAQHGAVEIQGKKMTLLIAPMDGFYSVPVGQVNPGETQMRIAYVESPENMALVPDLLIALLQQYEAQR